MMNATNNKNDLETKSKENSRNEDVLERLIVDKTRIRDADGYCGTVRYVGPVASAKNATEVYVGIEWDDGTRGKHDGSVICRKTRQLHRHFTCQNNNAASTAASFMRWHTLDLGVALDRSLIESKYVATDDPQLEAPNQLLPHYANTSSGKRKPIEFWGELKIRRHQQADTIQKMGFRNMGISSIQQQESTTTNENDSSSSHGTNALSDEEEAKQRFEFVHVKDVDLAGNLLSDWNSVWKLSTIFPKVTHLSAASNHLGDFTPPPPSVPLASQEAPFSLSQLQVLNLNSCQLKSFASIVKLATWFPNLTELCLANNHFTDIEQILKEHDDKHNNDAENNNGKTLLGKLVVLDLSSCSIHLWDRVLMLSTKFPQLESLILNHNPISTTKTTATSPSLTFLKLQRLSILGCEIGQWTDLSLEGLPCLKSLVLRQTPLTKTMSVAESRYQCIARFPTLEMLNSTTISSRERTEAERRYTSFVAQQLLLLQHQNNNDNKENQDNERLSEILKANPRFSQLKEKYMPDYSVNQENATAAHSTTNNAGGMHPISVTITSLAHESCHMDPLQRRLPLSLTVGRLQSLCRRAFGLDVDLQILHFRRPQQDAFPVELNDKDRTLGYYGVCNGAEILMNEVDPTMQQVARQEAAQDFEERMAKQEEQAMALQKASQQQQQ